MAHEMTIVLDTAYARWALITPSDTTVLDPVPNALYSPTSDVIAIEGNDGTPMAFHMSGGAPFPVRPTKVRATGTNASPIYALYTE